MLPPVGRQLELGSGAVVTPGGAAKNAAADGVNVTAKSAGDVRKDRGRQQEGAGTKLPGKQAGKGLLPANATPAAPAVPQAAAAAGQRAIRSTLPAKQVDAVSPPVQTHGRAEHHQQDSQLPLQKQHVSRQAPDWPAKAATAGPNVAVTAAAPAEPMSEAAFGKLPLLNRPPHVGDVLAYRLLEIGVDMQPAVSEVRCGRWVSVAMEGHMYGLQLGCNVGLSTCLYVGAGQQGT